MPFDEEDPPHVEPDTELTHWTGVVIGAAIEVHKRLGPGLDEAIYAAALWRELALRGVPFQKEVLVPVEYKGEIIGKKRIDLIVSGKIIVELKVVESLHPLHSAQLKTYLKITNLKLGLLINFNSIILKSSS
jgi:GxxExxY protein